MLRDVIRAALQEIKAPQGADVEAVKGVIWEHMDMEVIVQRITQEALNIVKGAKNSRVAARALKEYFGKQGLTDPEAAAHNFVQRLGIRR